MVKESRLLELQDRFHESFGDISGTHLLRAPGRVNLIGEHTDYNGLPVYPVAIQKEIAVLFRPRTDSKVRVCDINPKFEAREFDVAETIPPYSTGDWGNYVKAAAQALSIEYGITRGFEAVYSGSIPSDAGLSSSSAMVVASSLAFLFSNELEPSLTGLMDLLATGEQYVGTRGGGMDQAICLGGRKQAALKIGFFPLSIEPIHIPNSWRFVVAHSLSTASKTRGALSLYNQRPLECRQALERLRLELGCGTEIKRISDLLKTYSSSQLIECSETLSLKEQRRLKHVLSEGKRVDLAQQAMSEDRIELFGRLMTESHTSMKEDFEISSAQLDTLVDACMQAGAKGARLTGAGFGGCVVALCSGQHLERFLATLENSFYKGHPDLARFPTYLFAVDPSQGAGLVY